MKYQNGSLKQIQRKDGLTWLYRFHVERPDGTRVENTRFVGRVADFPNMGRAWKQVDKLGLRLAINTNSDSDDPTFVELVTEYFNEEYGPDASEMKANTTTESVKHIPFNVLVPEFGRMKVASIKPKQIREFINDPAEKRIWRHLQPPNTKL